MLRHLGGAAVVLACAVLGQLTADLTAVPLPGPVVGMLLLLLLMCSRAGRHVEALVGGTAGALLAVLPLLLVPVAVGAAAHVDVLVENLLPLAAALLGTWVLLAAAAAGASTSLRPGAVSEDGRAPARDA